jgi:hypothetical protein
MFKVGNLAAMTFAAALAFGAASAVAQNLPVAGRSSPPISNTSLTLISTVIHQSATTHDSSVPSSQVTAIDTPVAFTCTKTCVIELEVVLQVGNQTSSGNTWGGVAIVDGSANNFSPILSSLPTNKSFDTRVFSFAIQFNPGRHTIQTAVFVKHTATLALFHIDYRLFNVG